MLSSTNNKKEVIFTDKTPEPGPYFRAINCGNLNFVACQTIEDSITSELLHCSPEKQADQILQNIKTILVAPGSGMDKALSCDVQLSYLNDKEEMNEIYRKPLPKNMPTRNCIAVAGIDDELDIEIEVIASANYRNE